MYTPRRRFLYHLAAILTLAVRGVRGQERPAETVSSALNALFSDRQALANIAQAALDSLPHSFCDAAPTQLQWLYAQHYSLSHLRTELARRRQQDFASGNVLQVKGWLLSATEVQVCLLAYRSRSPHVL